MNAVLLMGHGELDQLQYRQYIKVPKPKEDDVLIRVQASAINNTDINTRTGWYAKQGQDQQNGSWQGGNIQFPRIQGADICGEIVAVGANVSSSRIGERVLVEPCLHTISAAPLPACGYLGSECDGGYAQYAVVAAKHAYKIDSELSSVELASFPCAYSTAENMLTRAYVGKNERVLISGASGGVGSAAVQLAKVRGAYVIAITSADKQEAVLAIGADRVLVRDADLVAELGENSVDVVIDLVAGGLWQQLLSLLKPKGRYAISGAVGGAMVDLDLRTLYLKDLSLFGCTELEPEIFINLVRYIELDKIKPLVANVFALSDIKAAQRFFLQKQYIGKVVLQCCEQ